MRKKIIELEKENKTEIIIKAGESKVEVLREIIELNWKELNTDRKILKTRNEKTNNRRN